MIRLHLGLRLQLFQLLALLALLAGSTACKTGKRGLAWPHELNRGVPFDAFPPKQMTAYYTWTPEPVRGAPFPFVPMLWGCDDATVRNFTAALDRNFAIDSYKPPLTKDKAILAFSEPGLKSQSNCTPAQAAKVWMDHIEPLKKRGYRLGTPAVTISESGHAWLLEWFVQCTACHPDFLAIHWYGTSFDDLQEKLTGYHDAFKMPIWLTEFAAQRFTNEEHAPDPTAPQPSLLEVTSILNQSMNWLDSTDWIERYFWYGAMYDMQTLNPFNSLFNADNRTGKLNALGELYVKEGCNNGAGRVSGLNAGMFVATALALLFVV